MTVFGPHAGCRARGQWSLMRTLEMVAGAIPGSEPAVTGAEAGKPD